MHNTNADTRATRILHAPFCAFDVVSVPTIGELTIRRGTRRCPGTMAMSHVRM
jgi:hypothetical protein